MTLDMAAIGQRLRQARENKHLSQDSVAKALGLDRTAITRIESGGRAVSTLELDKLAKLYDRPIHEFFAVTKPGEEDVVVALHRLAPSLAADEKIKVEVDRCLDLCQEGRFLEKTLDAFKNQMPASYSYPVPKDSWDAINQGNRLAEEERRRLGLGLLPIANVSDLIAEQGVWATTTPLPDAMSGLFLRHATVGMVIIVNAGHERARKRFSFAHEYAHALVDVDRTVTVSSQDNAQENIERRANVFAAAFLMPEDGVREFLGSLDKDRGSRDVGAVFSVAGNASIDLGTRPKSAHPITPQDVAMLARHFGVSYQAAIFRLKSLRMVGPAEFDALNARPSIDAGRDYLKALRVADDEPKSDLESRELVAQIAHLAVEAHRRECISAGRLRDLAKKLGLDGRALLEAAMAGRTHAE